MTLMDDRINGANLNQNRLADLCKRAQYAIDKGPLPSLQIALARHGRLVFFATFGAADNSTRFHIFSCTKPLVASAIWQLCGAGQIRIERPVAHYIPAFAANGKQAVTVEQVLCHTSGFPQAALAAPDWWTRQGRLNSMRHWRLQWAPGSRMEYHPFSAHWVLAELIEGASGRDYRDYIHSKICQPLGLASLRLGVPADEQGDIAALRLVGEATAVQDLTERFGSAIPWPNTVDDSLLLFNATEVRALGIPGGGAVSTAADVALFYQGLLRNPGELWQPQVLAEAVGRVRVTLTDPFTGAPANRGLGVVIAGSDKYRPYRGMGMHVSAQAFGHPGVGGQVAWGDPASGISFCALTNGLDANPLRSARLCVALSNLAAGSALAGQ